VFRRDAITVTYVPDTYAQTTIAEEMVPQAVPIRVQPQPHCPGRPHDALCGFAEGMEVLIFDGVGAYDTFTIDSAREGALQLRHQGDAQFTTYAIGSPIARATRRTIYYSNNQLRVVAGHADVPVVDHVVSLAFDYFGTPDPPTTPKPPPGTANCLYDESGSHRSTTSTLPAVDGGLAALPGSTLTDGPWCGGGTNEYDADLLRVRKIRITLRMQAANPALRGSPVADYVLTFDITPRNLNLSR
jgi:hypothetical protein